MNKKNKKNFKLIIFDFDNTIGKLDVDWRRLINTLNIKEPLNDYLDRINKEDRQKIFKIIEANEMEKIDNFKPDNDVVSFITNCDGYTLAILSSNSKKAIETALKRLGLLDKFDIILSGEDVERLKPSSEGIIKILDELGIDKDDAIFLGDSYVDMKACNAAGVKFVLSLDELKESLDCTNV